MFTKTRKFSRMTSMMVGSACVALIACGSAEEIKSPITSAQQVCQEAQDSCKAEIEAAIAKLKESQDGCAKTLQDVCSAQGGAQVDADACEAAVKACEGDLKTVAEQQSTLGETCSDKLAASCKSEELPIAPPATNAACSAAQATCQAAVEALGAKQEDLHLTCGTSVQEACSSGNGEDCDKARAACEDAVKATQDEAKKLHASCATSITAACMNMSASGGQPPASAGSTTPPKFPAPNSGGQATPDATKCEAALRGCEGAVKGDIGEANKACKSAVTAGCGPTGSAESCKAAHEQCKLAHEGAQAAFESAAAECQKSVEDSCK